MTFHLAHAQFFLPGQRNAVSHAVDRLVIVGEEVMDILQLTPANAQFLYLASVTLCCIQLTAWSQLVRRRCMSLSSPYAYAVPLPGEGDPVLYSVDRLVKVGEEPIDVPKFTMRIQSSFTWPVWSCAAYSWPPGHSWRGGDGCHPVLHMPRPQHPSARGQSLVVSQSTPAETKKKTDAKLRSVLSIYPVFTWSLESRNIWTVL